MFQKNLITSIAVLVLLSFSKPAIAQDTESYVGVGLTMEQVEIKNKKTNEKFKSFLITDLIGEAPAQRSGAKTGDLIRAVEGKNTDDQKLKTVSEWMAGELGTNLTLTLETIGSPARDVTMTRELITYECFMKGWVNLRYYGDQNSGNFTGNIGNQYVNWNYFAGSVTGHFKNQHLRFNANVDFSGNITINGFLGSSNIYWNGYNNSISTFQPCVR